MALLTQNARSSANAKEKYTIDEDRIICEELEKGTSVPQIQKTLQAAGHTRTVMSLRYRVSKLRSVADEFDSLEELHGIAVPVVESVIEPSDDEEDEVGVIDEEDEVEVAA